MISMGKKDTITKDYMKDNAVFADVFNYLMYEGKNVIQPEQLRPFDTTAVVIPDSEIDSYRPVQKVRDEFKGAVSRISSGEFLTGFYKKDRLIPVVTLVIYLGADVWEAPRNLHEMFDITSEEVLRYIPDYKINLIAPAEMTDEEINQFQTDFREVMLFVKYSKDKKYLKKLVSEDTHFSSMNVKTARVISAVTGIEIEAEDYICLYTKR